MNIIGTFTKNGETYSGTIHTLPFSGAATLEPVKDKPTDRNFPDFQVFTTPTRKHGRVQIGRAYKERSEAGNEYLAVRLDEPSFPAPIFCRLIQLEGEESHSLIWSRS